MPHADAHLAANVYPPLHAHTYRARTLFAVVVRDVPTGHPVATMVNAAAGASKEDDIQKMLKCATHLGTKNCDVLMEPYVFKRRVDGTFCQAGDAWCVV